MQVIINLSFQWIQIQSFALFSAGVGRTGTYIAVDIIRRLINQSQKSLSLMKLDVMGIVYQLRQDRGKMVQTKVCLHSIYQSKENISRLGTIHIGQSLCRRTSKTNPSIRRWWVLNTIKICVNIRYLVVRHALASADGCSESGEYANCTPPDKDAGLDGSVSYTKKGKTSTYQNGGDAHDSDAVYREAM